LTNYIKPHRLVAHRGVWREKSEQNTLGSFEAALDFGFGIETDLRDYSRTIYISHDPVDQPLYGFDQFVDKINGSVDAGNETGLIALNIKADGLIGLIQGQSRPKFEHFYFDMSIPQMVQYFSAGKPLAARWSELEDPTDLFRNIDFKYVWVDSFLSDWVVERSPLELKLDSTKKYVFVSPELHGRDPRAFWAWFERQHKEHENIFLCTDFPLRLAGF
jgi:hypothetical protein